MRMRFRTLLSIYNPDYDGFLYGIRDSHHRVTQFKWISSSSDDLAYAYGTYDMDGLGERDMEELLASDDLLGRYLDKLGERVWGVLMVVPLRVVDGDVEEIEYHKGFRLL